MEENNGRPRLEINREAVLEYRRAGLKWTDISNMLEISNSTLLRWRRRYNIEV